MLEVLPLLVFAYLLGSMPSGLVVAYLLLRRDIRQVGSGKTGTTNVLRTAGKPAAIGVLAADVAKGAIPGAIGLYLLDSHWAGAVASAVAVSGHIWPIFAGFRGGRGVATTFGGVLALAPLLSLAVLAIAALLLVPWRIVSLMSVIGTPLSACVLIAAWVIGWQPFPVAAYALFAVAIVEYQHIPNIKRLLAGTEPRLGQGGDRPATG